MERMRLRPKPPGSVLDGPGEAIRRPDLVAPPVRTGDDVRPGNLRRPEVASIEQWCLPYDRLPAARSTTPPISATAPAMGGNGTLCVFSRVA